MNEAQILEYFKATYGPGFVVFGWLLSKGLYNIGAKFLPPLLNLITEIRLLRTDIDPLKKLVPRVDKLEVDMHANFRRLRDLESVHDQEPKLPNGG